MPSLWSKMKSAAQDLGDVQPLTEEDMSSPVALPNEIMAGRGLGAAWTAFQDLQPDAVNLPLPHNKLVPSINVQPTIGSIKLKPGVNFEQYEKVMGGKNPLDMDRRQLGIWVQSLGPSMRLKASELTGAQGLDEFSKVGSTPTPAELIRMRLDKEGIPPDRIPQVKNVPHDPIFTPYLGAYGKTDNEVLLNPHNLSIAQKMSQHPEALTAGVALHEAKHAEQILNGAELGLPEAMISGGPYTNKELFLDGAMRPESLQVIFERMKEAPYDPSQRVLDPALYAQLRSGSASPELLAQHLSRLAGRGDYGQQIRQQLGSAMRTWKGASSLQGMRGTNPNLWAAVQSAGHFADPIQSELDIPVLHLAKEQARRGGDVGPWGQSFKNEIEKAYGEYHSPMVQNLPRPPNPLDIPIGEPNYTPSEPAQAFGPGAGLAALTAGGAGYAAGRTLNLRNEEEPGYTLPPALWEKIRAITADMHDAQ